MPLEQRESKQKMVGQMQSGCQDQEWGRLWSELEQK